MNKAIADPEAMAQISRLYVEVTGQLTGKSIDTLNDALATYPAPWLVQALNEAKKKHVHNWRYCEVILEKRHKETNVDPDKYIRGKYAGIRDPIEMQRVFALRKQRLEVSE